MYVSPMVLTFFVGMFAALAYSVWNTRMLESARRNRVLREEDDRRHKAQVAEEVRRLFWGISDAMELETSYEAHAEYLEARAECLDDEDYDDDEGDGITIWMKTEDVLETAETNASNATVLLHCIEQFPHDAADLYELTGSTWSEVNLLFSEYVERLRVIAETHEAEAARRIESFLDDPLLIARPASQVYVEAVAAEIWFGFEDHARKVHHWAIDHAVDRRPPSNRAP